MRFDDTLRTVLAADCTTPYGAQAAWRQLVDLVGRGPREVGAEPLERLRAIRSRVPLATRIASARALEYADLPPALVALFVEDDAAVAAPVLRGARLDPEAWVGLLPRLDPGQRSILRHRRDLDARVTRALDAFGPIDFVLGDANAAGRVAPEPPASPARPIDVPHTPEPFLALGKVAFGLPVVDEALRQQDSPAVRSAFDPGEPQGPFRIADVVARIDAYRERQDDGEARQRRRGSGNVTAFRFETDTAGLLRWIDGTDRAPLIGLSIARRSALAQTDAAVASAFRQRAAFRDARLEIDGASPVAGSWRISGVPVFDPGTGRFTGYRGNVRRPRADEGAARPAIQADSLRQLVHELRTPANAIAGFAEMIDTQLLGPVPEVYRGYAGAIRGHIADLLAAIDDLDLAARIEGSALSLVPGRIALRDLVEQIVGDLAPLAALRAAHILIDGDEVVVEADARAAERLLGRLIATILGGAERDEEIAIAILPPSADDRYAVVRVELPQKLAERELTELCAIEDEVQDGTLLGTGFAFRLVANLARELGGSLDIGPGGLTLRLPAAEDAAMDHATQRR